MAEVDYNGSVNSRRGGRRLAGTSQRRLFGYILRETEPKANLMKDERKTKLQLMGELAGLRQQVAELEMIRTENRYVSERERRGAHLNQILLDAFPCEAILLHPVTFEIIAANRAAIDAGAIPGATCFATMEQQDGPCPWCLGPQAWSSSQPQRLERESDGVFWDAYWIPVSDDMYVHYAFDVTERKQTEE